MHIPLRVHSVYSKGKGSATLKELPSWVCRTKLPSAALTDIGNLYGWGEWKRAALENGFTPLFGCEMEVEGKRFLFLVKSREGYWNLMETFNRKRISTTEGLVTIFIPQAGGGELPEAFSSGSKEDFYLGVDFFNFKKALTLAQSRDFPLVWANPLKFVEKPERLILLHSIQKKIPFPPERDRLKPRMELFGPHQEALALQKFGPGAEDVFKRTFEVAEKCRFSFEDIVPPLPGNLFSTSLREVVMDRLRRLKNLSWRGRQRAQQELEAIESSGFAPYFL
ncbi:MAG: PHP domain-containing protein, partial [Candidatus Aminicenantes bacterium]|nr:PHP domain-containing protein [Candidatus Aminicenantes bacterium]